MESPSLQVLFEDAHIIVCKKPAGIATQSGKIKEPDMVSLLKNILFQKNPSAGEPYLAVIHRLDQPVCGLLTFARTPAAAKDLNRQLTGRGFGKYYRVLVEGCPSPGEGTLENYLRKNPETHSAEVCGAGAPNAKFARLHYQTIEEDARLFSHIRETCGSSSPLTELEICLDTGRYHQIRIQLAKAGYPVVGDRRYNPGNSGAEKGRPICLCAYKLTFRHPKTKKPLCFTLSPAELPEFS